MDMNSRRELLEGRPLADLRSLATVPNEYQSLAQEILKERDRSMYEEVMEAQEKSQRQRAEEKEFRSSLIALNASKNSYITVHKRLQAVEEDCAKWDLLPQGQQVSERFLCRKIPRGAVHQVKIREMRAAKQEYDDAKTLAVKDIRSLTPLRDAFADFVEARGWLESAVEEIRAARIDSAALKIETEPISNAELFVVHTPDVVSGTNEDKIKRVISATDDINEASNQTGPVHVDLIFAVKLVADISSFWAAVSLGKAH